jgi:hypothetical protein
MSVDRKRTSEINVDSRTVSELIVTCSFWMGVVASLVHIADVLG